MSGRIQVVSGGELSPEELAALVLALTPVAAPEEEEATGVAEPGRDVPAWGVAALLEGVGGAPLPSHADLTHRLGAA